MGFESKVLSKVQEVTDSKASFYNGTLYVECDMTVASQIKQALKSVTEWEAYITQIGNTGEVAFDF